MKIKRKKETKFVITLNVDEAQALREVLGNTNTQEDAELLEFAGVKNPEEMAEMIFNMFLSLDAGEE